MSDDTRYGDYGPEDLTARARIRDAALRQFAENGFHGTSIRSVAKEAGVSPALVQRHFDTKDGLRTVCDEYAIGTLLAQARQVMDGDTARPGLIAGMVEASRTSTAYLARALVEGTPIASEYFDRGAETSEEFLTARWPDRFPPGAEATRDAAAVMAAMHSGVLALHQQLTRRLGADVLAREQMGRLAAAITAVYGAMGDYLASGQGAQLRDQVEDYGRDRAAERKGDDD